ncbi:MAG: ATP-binding protein [Methylovulum sp.]|nr:ATP-binding protein [Methylovulum sp.]
MNKSADYRCLSQQLPNTLEALSLLADQVEAFGAEAGWTDAVLMQTNLVLEELIVNVINYGYPDGRSGSIDVLIETNAENISIRITDDGDAFDPFAVATPDLLLDIADRPIGGLGIHLVRNYMDTCTYQYVNHHNEVVLTKHWAENFRETG